MAKYNRIALHMKPVLLISCISILCVSAFKVEAADYFKGKTLYSKHCVQCHGSDGKGQLAGTPNFTQGHRLMRSDVELLKTIETGKNAMPSFRGVLKHQEMLDTIAYIRTFF